MCTGSPNIIKTAPSTSKEMPNRRAATKPVNMEIGSFAGEITANKQTNIKRKASLPTINGQQPMSKMPKLSTQFLSVPIDLSFSFSELMLRAANLEIIANETSNDIMQIIFLVGSALYLLLAGVDQDDETQVSSLFNQSLNMLK